LSTNARQSIFRKGEILEGISTTLASLFVASDSYQAERRRAILLLHLKRALASWNQPIRHPARN
jgi:hypothetical protein